MITNYRIAWIQFRKTKEYMELINFMKVKGFKQRYADNILKVAFAAGWGDKGIIFPDELKNDKDETSN